MRIKEPAPFMKMSPKSNLIFSHRQIGSPNFVKSPTRTVPNCHINLGVTSYGFVLSYRPQVRAMCRPVCLTECARFPLPFRNPELFSLIRCLCPRLTHAPSAPTSTRVRIIIPFSHSHIPTTDGNFPRTQNVPLTVSTRISTKLSFLCRLHYQPS